MALFLEIESFACFFTGLLTNADCYSAGFPMLALQNQSIRNNVKTYSLKILKSVRDHGVRATAIRILKRAGAAATPVYDATVHAYLERRFDRKWGIETAAHWDHPNTGDPITQLAERYEPTSPSIIEKIMQSLGCLTCSYTFYDIGCGKGRVLVMASLWNFKRVVGIEFSEHLVHIAVQNIRKFKAQHACAADIEVVFCDATQYIFPDEDALFFLFNPFKEDVMKKVLDNIRSSVQVGSNRYIIYHNPVLAPTLFNANEFLLILKSTNFSIYKVIP